MSKNISLKKIQLNYAKFTEDRGWNKNQNPANTFTALMAEIGELANTIYGRKIMVL